MLNRALRAVRVHGPGGVARIAGRRAQRLVWLRESHIWYQLDVAGERPRRELPDGLELRRAGEDDLAAIERVPGAEPASALRDGLAAGHELWVVGGGERLAFVCWIQNGAIPLRAGPGGALELPPGVVCLEDSITSPDFRGQGIAPGAWCGLADRLAAAGKATMITKVGTENVPSRRAVEKAGFREIATMQLTRLGASTRVAMTGVNGALAQELAQQLGC